MWLRTTLLIISKNLVIYAVRVFFFVRLLLLPPFNMYVQYATYDVLSDNLDGYPHTLYKYS